MKYVRTHAEIVRRIGTAQIAAASTHFSGVIGPTPQFKTQVAPPLTIGGWESSDRRERHNLRFSAFTKVLAGWMWPPRN
jgi:hypothetical protein